MNWQISAADIHRFAWLILAVVFTIWAIYYLPRFKRHFDELSEKHRKMSFSQFLMSGVTFVLIFLVFLVAIGSFDPKPIQVQDTTIEAPKAPDADIERGTTASEDPLERQKAREALKAHKETEEISGQEARQDRLDKEMKEHQKKMGITPAKEDTAKNKDK